MLLTVALVHQFCQMMAQEVLEFHLGGSENKVRCSHSEIYKLNVKPVRAALTL